MNSKHIKKIVIESADSKRKRMESVVQHIGLKHREFRQVFVKQKRLRDIWGFFYRREKDLLKHKIRIFRAQDNFVSIDDDGVKYLMALQKYFLIKLRNCITSTFFKFWKSLIFYRYSFIFLRHFLGDGPLSQNAFIS